MNITTVKLTGTRPLMLGNPRLIDPLDEHTRRIASLLPKRGQKPTEDEVMALYRAKWEGSLYFDPAVGPYITDEMLFGSLYEGAKQFKQGPVCLASVEVPDTQLPIEYEGPRKLDAMWRDGRFRDVRAVNVGSASKPKKVMTCRPLIPTGWSVTATIVFGEKVSAEDILRWAQAAGDKGVGTFRRKFGRYTVATVKP